MSQTRYRQKFRKKITHNCWQLWRIPFPSFSSALSFSLFPSTVPRWLVGWFGPRPHFSRIRQRKKREKKKLLASASPERTKLPSLPLPSSAVSTRPIPCGKGGGGAEGWALTQFATSPSSPSPNRYKAAAEKIRPANLGGNHVMGKGREGGVLNLSRVPFRRANHCCLISGIGGRGGQHKKGGLASIARGEVCVGGGGGNGGFNFRPNNFYLFLLPRKKLPAPPNLSFLSFPFPFSPKMLMDLSATTYPKNEETSILQINFSFLRTRLIFFSRYLSLTHSPTHHRKETRCIRVQ